MTKEVMIKEIKNILKENTPSMTFWSEEKVREYHAQICTADTPQAINFAILEYLNLTMEKYHGGTTFSSGALPKWDLGDNKYMVKRCGIDPYGNHLTDYANEELVYRFCDAVGIKSAKYKAITITYFDEELRKELETPAVITEIFSGDLMHYRDIRRRNSFGRVNDEIIDFTDAFPVAKELNDMLLIDYVFNQQDRHSKNIGMIGNNLSPIYDSGASMFFDILDSQLNESLYTRIPRHKTFGKTLREQLVFSLTYVEQQFSVAFNCDLFIGKFNNILSGMENHYSHARLDFIKGLVERRLQDVRQILSKI